MNNKKTAVGGGSFGNRSIYTAGTNQRRIGFNSNRISSGIQCKNCGSDYMKYSFQDLCQDCLQRAHAYLTGDVRPKTSQHFNGGAK